ncbi:hypothetical protein QCA50_002836 [Cerrena zonata]|uniref:Uncharacterized protein n=1 Tax=Cerrena zonata TaxID=2478898 RepID=A0AAW0GN48_9APHY
MLFMRSLSLSFLTTLVLSFSLAHQAIASSHGAVKRRHHVNVNTVERRAENNNVRMTFYKTGLGACGGYNGDNDFIVALNVPQYGTGGQCGKTITINYQGKTTQATVADECMECPYGAIDLSPGLFSFLNNGDMGAGTIYGDWGFGADAPKPTTTSSTPPPPPPTTTSHTPSTTSTPPPPTTSSKARPSTSSSSSSSAPPSSSSSATPRSTSSTPTASATPTPVLETGTLNVINQAFIGLAGLALQAFPQN